jgi:hypothetical protein
MEELGSQKGITRNRRQASPRLENIFMLICSSFHCECNFELLLLSASTLQLFPLLVVVCYISSRYVTVGVIVVTSVIFLLSSVLMYHVRAFFSSLHVRTL